MEGASERAKGSEPATPTLARSCATTELHPHPATDTARTGNAQSYAKSGGRMQQGCDIENRTIFLGPGLDRRLPTSAFGRNCSDFRILLISAAPLTGFRWIYGRLEVSVWRNDSSQSPNQPRNVAARGSP